MRAADNPFAVHRVLRERYRMSESHWARLLVRLEQLDWRGAIVGPHGSGKTTLLEDLAARLESRGWHVQMESAGMAAQTPNPTPQTCLLVDGVETLSWLQWCRLRLQATNARGLVITTHRAGRLGVLHRCTTSPELLREITTSLHVPITPDESMTLHARHGGNLREALRELYDRAG